MPPTLVLARDAITQHQSLQLGSTRPADLKVPLDEVWAHTEDTRPADLDFANYGYDQTIAGEGKINYCVRWEAGNSVSAATRADVATAVQRSFQTSVDVAVVGWAVTDEGLLEGGMGDVHVYTTVDGEGAPECDPRCKRFFHQDGDYSECLGGAAMHYDLSLWLTDGFEGGAGGDWDQRMASEYFIDAVNQEDNHIHLHELGHTFGLDGEILVPRPQITIVPAPD